MSVVGRAPRYREGGAFSHEDYEEGTQLWTWRHKPTGIEVATAAAVVRWRNELSDMDRSDRYDVFKLQCVDHKCGRGTVAIAYIGILMRFAF